MAFNINALGTIINLVVPAIQLAEKYIRGKGRGVEKREAVIDQVVEGLQTQTDAPRVNGIDYPNFGDGYDWLGLLANAGEVRERVGRIVDEVVALLNFLGQFDKD